ncbi:MAG: hypothetical protein P8Z33_01620 [Gammaproteobacteria bacterium]|jgi:hypothetical protein
MTTVLFPENRLLLNSASLLPEKLTIVNPTLDKAGKYVRASQKTNDFGHSNGAKTQAGSESCLSGTPDASRWPGCRSSQGSKLKYIFEDGNL